MTGRSIPEIIGWERHERDAAWDADWNVIHRLVWFTKPGVDVDIDGIGMSPTVDDLLAWIRARGFDFYANASWVTHNPYFVSVAGTEHSLRPVVRVEARGHTLLGALEAAVKAIDAEMT